MQEKVHTYIENVVLVNVYFDLSLPESGRLMFTVNIRLNPFKGLCYLGCLAPPNSKALNPQHIFARAPREKSPLAPPISWAEGPAGGARGDFSRGALAKMCWSLGGLLLGGARQPGW